MLDRPDAAQTHLSTPRRSRCSTRRRTPAAPRKALKSNVRHCFWAAGVGRADLGHHRCLRVSKLPSGPGHLVLVAEHAAVSRRRRRAPSPTGSSTRVFSAAVGRGEVDAESGQSPFDVPRCREAGLRLRVLQKATASDLSQEGIARHHPDRRETFSLVVDDEHQAAPGMGCAPSRGALGSGSSWTPQPPLKTDRHRAVGVHRSRVDLHGRQERAEHRPGDRLRNAPPRQPGSWESCRKGVDARQGRRSHRAGRPPWR